MTVLRFPGYSSGADISGEPESWLVYDTETKERRVELNPNYVPPPPPTAVEIAEWDVQELEVRLEDARAALADLLAEESATQGESA